MPLAYDVGVTAPTFIHNNFVADACMHLTLTISIKKTDITDEDVYRTPNTFINGGG